MNINKKKDKLSKLELALRKNLKKRKNFQIKIKNKKNKQNDFKRQADKKNSQ